MNGLAGIGSRGEATVPTDHITAETRQSRTPVVAPPLRPGCSRTATPAKPTPTPASTMVGTRSPSTSRSTTTHSGIDAMISDASPIGVSCSA